MNGNHTSLEFSADRTGRWSRAVARGEARRIAPGIYTPDTTTPVETVVRRELWRILAHEFRDAVVTDRTARNPSLGGDPVVVVFCAHPHRRRVLKLPGATIAARPGRGAEPDDPPFRDGTRIASEPRALLENARTSRPTSGLPARTLSRAELADWIAHLVATRGVDRVNRLRDQMRSVADRLDLKKEYEVVAGLLGAALGSQPAPTSATPAVRALYAGRGFDQSRVQRFDDLAAAMDASDLPVRPGTPGQSAFAFFEAYFSNLIEGTEFTVSEALEVVFADVVPPGHTPADAHDVRGTYALVSDPRDMSRTPTDADDLLALLTERHRVLLGGRPDHHPGEFKRVANRVGTYVFVAPDLVEGTLDQAFVHARSVRPGLARAIYWLFAIAEIHPFDDGNGRIARVFMNAELSAVAEERIIFPTVFRYEYLNALRALSHSGHVEALVKVCGFAQSWTAAIDFSSVESARSALEATNAFADPQEASDQGVRLQLP